MPLIVRNTQGLLAYVVLFDENLSPKLAVNLNDVFPDSKHVDRIGLGGESDNVVCVVNTFNKCVTRLQAL
jgi:predicted nuclease of predicted toxin-antitoxin system